MVQNKITKLYGTLESTEVKLGGGGGFEGFYGSITGQSLSRVYDSMREHCNFDEKSFLVDVGGGLGRPLVHALIEPGVSRAIGLELDEIKCMKSESMIRAAFPVAKDLASNTSAVEPRVLHRDVEKMKSNGTLDPCTHAYSFWEGIPATARMAFGELFHRSSTLKCVAIVQRAIRKEPPSQFMSGLSFGDLELMETLSGIHMSGVILVVDDNNRSFKAYIFKRLSPPGKQYQGPLRLDKQLVEPRLLQTSIPRLLRSSRRREVLKQHNKVPVEEHHIRVSLKDTIKPENIPKKPTKAPAVTRSPSKKPARNATVLSSPSKKLCSPKKSA